MSKYKEGDVVAAFLDYQKEKIFLGRVTLIKFIEKGLPFMLEDFTNSPTYNTEKWEVEWKEKVVKTHPYESKYAHLRYQEKQNQETEVLEEETLYEQNSNGLNDSFYKVDGEEIF